MTSAIVAADDRNTGTKTETEQIVSDARKRLEAAWTHDRENRQEAAVDLAFLAGDQWPDAVRREREASKRPMLTFNRLPQFLRQVTNDIRQSDLAIKVSPVDDKSDPELAKIYNGLLRQIQYQSNAHHVYSNAAEHQAACGIGWFRILTEFADEDSFDQEIRVRAIPHPLSVYCDPAAMLPDRSDAEWIIVTEMIPSATFKTRFPGKTASDVDRPLDNSMSRLYWITADAVRVAEYWVKTPYTKKIGLTADGQTIDLTDVKPEMRAFMPPVVKERETLCHKIEMYLVTGTQILSGPHEWAGKYIPLVPVVGAEIPLDQKIYRHGVIRYARDPQQLYNYMRTAAAEWIGLAPKSPYLLTKNMIGDPNMKALWDSANTTHRPYLVYNPDPQMPSGPKREHPPEMPTAVAQEAQLAADDMKATTGIYDAGLGARSNETSGRAIMARQKEGDVATYHFADNLEQSLQHAGRIMVDLIPKIYDNERVIRLIGEDDSEEFAPINQAVMGMDGMPILKNDLASAKFGVRVSIGPSYTTKRQETAEAMMQFIQAVPAVGAVAADLIAKNMDFPGADEIAKRLRNTIPPQVLVDPNDPKTVPPPPNPLDDPVLRSEVVLRDAQAEKAYADAAKVRSETAMAAAGMVPGATAPQPLPPPEQVLMPPPAPPQMPPGMGEPPEMEQQEHPGMGGIDPDALQEMLARNPSGPSQPAFGA